MAEIKIQPKNLEVDVRSLFGTSLQESFLQKIISELEKKVKTQNVYDTSNYYKDIDNE